LETDRGTRPKNCQEEILLFKNAPNTVSAAFGWLDDTVLAQPGALRIGARECKNSCAGLETQTAVTVDYPTPGLILQNP
jgi:hypothetical protein